MPVEKSTLRRELRARLRALSPDHHAAASAHIGTHLSDWPTPATGRLLAAFLPLPSEPDLRRFYRTWETGGGRLAAPLITAPNSLEFRVLPSGALDDASPSAAGLRPGPHGLREPDPAQCPLASPEEISLILVPGLGFARGGARLGRGAGYYDRWLASLPTGIPTIGVAFALQIVPDLPREPHDWLVDHIVTEAGWLPGTRGLPPPQV